MNLRRQWRETYADGASGRSEQAVAAVHVNDDVAGCDDGVTRQQDCGGIILVMRECARLGDDCVVAAVHMRRPVPPHRTRMVSPTASSPPPERRLCCCGGLPKFQVKLMVATRESKLERLCWV